MTDSVLDEGIKDAHDDPQNFSLIKFDLALKSLYNTITTHKTITLWATYYYIPELNHSEHGVEMLDEKGNEIGLKLNPCDWCNACIEGTVLVKKADHSFLLNYAGRSTDLQYDCRKCKRYKTYDGYQKTGRVLWQKNFGYGEGVKRYRLVPFKTVAVDGAIIPFGSVIFIPEAKGVNYYFEDTTLVHDGYFFAADRGSKIKGNHIDVFLGTAKTNPFGFITSDSNKMFKAYIVEDSTIRNKLERLHRLDSQEGKDFLVRICETIDCEPGSSCGYVNSKGDTVVPIGQFHSCYTDTIRKFGFVLDTNGVCKAISNTGKYLYNVKWYDNGPDAISEGLFRIVIAGKTGYANESGDIVIAPRYACSTPFKGGKAKVSYHCTLTRDGEYISMESEGWFYIDKMGRPVE